MISPVIPVKLIKDCDCDNAPLPVEDNYRVIDTPNNNTTQPRRDPVDDEHLPGTLSQLCGIWLLKSKWADSLRHWNQMKAFVQENMDEWN